jgi:hypothetical protein
VALDIAERQVIATGAITVEVTDVAPAIPQVRAVAEGLGGFVEQLASYGDADRQQASITIRVPQAQFFTALERLEKLGTVQNRNVGSQDVTEQFIDLEARLKSAQRREQSLLMLLDKVQSVSDVVTIQRELEQVRSEIERLQGQMNFLKRRVDLATITVTLVPPRRDPGTPPSAALVIQAADVSRAMDSINYSVASLGGVVDSASLSERDGKRFGRMSFRVFAPKFDQALQMVQDQGTVTQQDISTGRPAKNGTQAKEQIGRAHV